MAATSSNKVAICYGFVGGPLHAKDFRERLNRAGFNLVSDPSDAEIVIAHSAGCWLIPQNIKPKLLIYIGMPLTNARAHRAWLSAGLWSMRAGFWHSLKIKLINGFYAFDDIWDHPDRYVEIIDYYARILAKTS